MAKRDSKKIDMVWILQLCLGVFFLIIGIWDVTRYSNNTLYLILAILEIASSVVLLVGLIGFLKKDALRLASLVVFIVWILRIVYFELVIVGFFQPNVLSWLYAVAVDIVILVSIWLVNRRYN